MPAAEELDLAELNDAEHRYDQDQEYVDVYFLYVGAEGVGPLQGRLFGTRMANSSASSSPPVQGVALREDGQEGDDALQDVLPVRREEEAGRRRRYH